MYQNQGQNKTDFVYARIGQGDNQQDHKLYNSNTNIYPSLTNNHINAFHNFQDPTIREPTQTNFVYAPNFGPPLNNSANVANFNLHHKLLATSLLSETKCTLLWAFMLNLAYISFNIIYTVQLKSQIMTNFNTAIAACMAVQIILFSIIYFKMHSDSFKPQYSKITLNVYSLACLIYGGLFIAMHIVWAKNFRYRELQIKFSRVVVVNGFICFTTALFIVMRCIGISRIGHYFSRSLINYEPANRLNDVPLAAIRYLSFTSIAVNAAYTIRLLLILKLNILSLGLLVMVLQIGKFAIYVCSAKDSLQRWKLLSSAKLAYVSWIAFDMLCLTAIIIIYSFIISLIESIPHPSDEVAELVQDGIYLFSLIVSYAVSYMLIKFVGLYAAIRKVSLSNLPAITQPLSAGYDHI